MKHKLSNTSCFVAHFDGDGNSLPPCVQCSTCLQWLRPEQYKEECGGLSLTASEILTGTASASKRSD